jgi:hypothetical protein
VSILAIASMYSVRVEPSALNSCGTIRAIGRRGSRAGRWPVVRGADSPANKAAGGGREQVAAHREDLWRPQRVSRGVSYRGG